ncbi:DUF3168 domain-containing protein [Cupriavidus sp. RAF20_2]|uniref:DUF3168 domain-containing protein n=1 Tax=Cupriavidus sp. RAF20_2 TaxID=3233053 RepID=UPI003F8EF3D7
MADSAESIIVAALAGLNVKVYPDVAPAVSTGPYITYQAVGGQDTNALDGPADLQNARMQVNVWAPTRGAAVSTMRAVFAALTDPTVGGIPIGAPVSTYESDTKLYGSRLDVSIWFRP